MRVIAFHVYHLKWLRCSRLIFFFLTGDKIVFTCDKKSGILSKRGKKKKLKRQQLPVLNANKTLSAFSSWLSRAMNGASTKSSNSIHHHLTASPRQAFWSMCVCVRVCVCAGQCMSHTGSQKPEWLRNTRDCYWREKSHVTTQASLCESLWVSLCVHTEEKILIMHDSVCLFKTF